MAEKQTTLFSDILYTLIYAAHKRVSQGHNHNVTFSYEK
jgi:hypothetical protein